MAKPKRNLDHLRAHLSMFEAEYPIHKGYIARLLMVDGRTVADVAKEVRGIVQANDPSKDIVEGSVKTFLYRFKKIILHKKLNLVSEWPSLIRLFLEPLRIPFKSFPAEPASSQPEQTSIPSPSRHPEPSSSPTSEMLLEPDIPVTSTLMQAVQNSTTINSPSCLMTCELPSPRKLKSYCANCVNKQRTITNMLQKNKHLHQQCKKFKKLSKAEKGNFSLKRYNEKIKRKTQSATKWKNRYASLSEACRDTFNLLKLVQRLEQQVKTLEGKLIAAQDENINMASINKRLESLLVKMENGDAYLKQVNEQLKNKLEKAEDDNAQLKRVHEQLKSKCVKTEDQDVHMKQVHEQLESILEKTEDDAADLNRYSQASHSPEMGIKEESPWEAADNCGNCAHQNDEIKQEPTYEEHPERNCSKETVVGDENAVISKDVASNISMKDILCGERCQVEPGDCLDQGPSIYIDNAEVSCGNISADHVNQAITAEEKVELNLFSENEATSSYVELCYTNSHAELKENDTHLSVHRT